MIISASRRTDIPHYYSGWFLNRIREGSVYVRNPVNPCRVSKICLSRDVVDCIVFWTKNPEPLMERLGELEGWPYYFQFTLTGYGKDIESGIPDKKKYMIPVFQRLSRLAGAERVVWRYDPVLFTDKYTPSYHLKAFDQISAALCGCTSECVISFVDGYNKNRRFFEEAGVRLPDGQQLMSFAAGIARTAASRGIRVTSCAEAVDLSGCGIAHGSCIDRERIRRITGCTITAQKDKNQRDACGCAESIDIGAYHTCLAGCAYCYANDSRQKVMRTRRLYDAHAPLLCGRLSQDDRVTERHVKSFRDSQLTIRDIFPESGSLRMTDR